MRRVSEYSIFLSISLNSDNDVDGCCAYRAEDSWIGLYKYNEDSESQSASAQYWLDGSTSTFRRWDNGDPDSETYCFIMKRSNGRFDDRSCGSNRRFVCKRTGT